MSDCYRDKEKLARLGDPFPKRSVCTACGGMTKVKDERCPECAGGGTREAQEGHLEQLVLCNASELSFRGTRHVARADGAAIIDLGRPIIEFGKLTLGPGDVLLYHASPGATAKENGRVARTLDKLIREQFPAGQHPAAVLVVPYGDAVDAFNIGRGEVSDESILDTLHRILGGRGERLTRSRVGLLGSRKKVPEAWGPPELGLALKKLLTDECEESREASVERIGKVVEECGLRLTKKPTLAEIMAERNRWMTTLGRYDTIEERQQLTEAIEAECLSVEECNPCGLICSLSNALSTIGGGAPLGNRRIVVVFTTSTWSMLGKPSAIMGQHVSFQDMTTDDIVIVTATEQGEEWSAGRMVLVKIHGDLDGLAEVAGQLKDECPRKAEAKPPDGEGLMVSGPVSMPADEHTVFPPEVVAKGIEEYVERRKEEGGPRLPWEGKRGSACQLKYYRLWANADGDWTVRVIPGSHLLHKGTADDLRSAQLAAEGGLKETVGERPFEKLVRETSKPDHRLDPEFIWAKRAKGGDSFEDELSCVCGEEITVHRKTVAAVVNCECGRKLRRTLIISGGSKWSVNSKPGDLDGTTLPGRVHVQTVVENKLTGRHSLACRCGKTLEARRTTTIKTCIGCGLVWEHNDGLQWRTRP